MGVLRQGIGKGGRGGTRNGKIRGVSGVQGEIFIKEKKKILNNAITSVA